MNCTISSLTLVSSLCKTQGKATFLDQWLGRNCVMPFSLFMMKRLRIPRLYMNKWRKHEGTLISCRRWGGYMRGHRACLWHHFTQILASVAHENWYYLCEGQNWHLSVVCWCSPSSADSLCETWSLCESWCISWLALLLVLYHNWHFSGVFVYQFISSIIFHPLLRIPSVRPGVCVCESWCMLWCERTVVWVRTVVWGSCGGREEVVDGGKDDDEENDEKTVRAHRKQEPHLGCGEL